MRREYLAVALAAMVWGSGSTFAQYEPKISRPLPTGAGLATQADDSDVDLPDPKPVYNYELKPEHGEYLVFVKSFRSKYANDKSGISRKLAEGLVEYIRTECRLYAYVHESGWLQRQERKKEKDAVVKAAKEYYASKGFTPDQVDVQLRKLSKMARIPDEYSVFVAPGKGSLKSMDEALDFAKYIRGLKSPPENFCDAVMVGNDHDVVRQKGVKKNPFLLAMPGRNRTIPKEAISSERPKADEFLLSLNAGKENSLIHNTKKPFTLVVKSYGASSGSLQRPGAVNDTGGRADGELLERAAQQAHRTAEMLRNMKPSYDAYVMHTKFESFVCVGEYDTKDDPRLKANAKALMSFAIKEKETGKVLDTFMEQPLPAIIPRP